jgi:hypothetical protein
MPKEMLEYESRVQNLIGKSEMNCTGCISGKSNRPPARNLLVIDLAAKVGIKLFSLFPFPPTQAG